MPNTCCRTELHDHSVSSEFVFSAGSPTLGQQETDLSISACTTSKQVACQSKKSISNVSKDEMSAGFAKAETFSTSGVRRNMGVSKGPITVTIK